jgi:hypothetical protein
MIQGTRSLLDLLLAGFLRWAGLPPADLKLLTAALCFFSGARELVERGGKAEEKK